MTTKLKPHEDWLECTVCEHETVADFEAGNGGGFRDEPDTVDSYTCQECGTTHVEDFYGDLVAA